MDRVTIDAIDPQVAPDAVFGDPIPPIAIAEIGLPGPTIPALPPRFDTGCRDDLLTAGDEPVPVRVQGPMADALAARPLTVSLCGVDEVALHKGNSHLVAAPGTETAIDVDRLVLRSSPGGSASPDTGRLVDGDGAGPRVEVREDGPSELVVRVRGAEVGRPFWLVLGQSYSTGWRAEIGGGAAWRNGRGSYLRPSGNQMPLADDVSVEGGHEANLVNTK